MSPRLSSLGQVAIALVIGSLVAAPPAGAQLDRWVKKAKDKVDRKVDDKVDKAMDDAIDKADPTTGGKGAPGQPSGSAAQPAPAAAAAKSKPGQGVWLNYDFVPGDRVLFFDDFSADRVGNFPQRLQFKQGNIEVAEFEDGVRGMRLSGRANVLVIPLPEVLPDKFTIEFDFRGNAHDYTHPIHLTGGSDLHAGEGRDWTTVSLLRWSAHLQGGGVEVLYDLKTPDPEEWIRFRMMADGGYVKCYLNEVRFANAPGASFERSKQLLISVASNEESPWYIGNLRVAASSTTLYDALMTKGRVATQGILFAVNSDEIRPESTPTLKEIGGMLEKNGGLKLLIEGHTDNTGNAEANLDLSRRRAESVKKYLVEQHKIAGDRLETKGFGASKPVADNAKPEGRQNNRRVELVKL